MDSAPPQEPAIPSTSPALVLVRLADTPGPAHAEARAFCLRTIAEVYGTAYRPDWHADLDALCHPPATNQYSTLQSGAFWTLRDETGLVATAGLRRLAWQPGILALFPHRYADGAGIATLSRAYVRHDRRGQGLGRRLAGLCEAEAIRLGATTLYLHAASDAAATLAFWTAAGYRPFASGDGSTHFDKPLHSPGTTRPPA